MRSRSPAPASSAIARSRASARDRTLLANGAVGDVVEHREPRKERTVLEHHHAVGAGVGNAANACKGLSVQRHLARGQMIEPREHVQQGALPASGRTDHRDEPPGGDLEAAFIERDPRARRPGRRSCPRRESKAALRRRRRSRRAAPSPRPCASRSDRREPKALLPPPHQALSGQSDGRAARVADDPEGHHHDDDRRVLHQVVGLEIMNPRPYWAAIISPATSENHAAPMAIWKP